MSTPNFDAEWAERLVNSTLYPEDFRRELSHVQTFSMDDLRNWASFTLRRKHTEELRTCLLECGAIIRHTRGYVKTAEFTRLVKEMTAISDEDAQKAYAKRMEAHERKIKRAKDHRASLMRDAKRRKRDAKNL